MANEVKSKWLEREFLLTLVGYAIGIVTTLGYLTPEQSSTLVEAASQFAGAVIIGLSAFGFSISRGVAKRPPVA